ncbi:AMP-binding protein [Streptomyces sp. NBC_01092]|uniref:AMP-binding protein n=1 Tax=Streptomyces sp. NBC_01092 TaxID=2903748 RepID=UPI00386B45CC|nr:AMP-binding protein [Streptomyces sp. NBC_01092]
MTIEARNASGTWAGAGPSPCTGLFGRFARGLSANPDGVALRVGRQALTYRDLDLRVREIAAGIRDADPRPPARVGVLAGKTVDGYAGILAASYCGAAAVPLNPRFPPSRIDTIATASGVSVLVADTAGAKTRETCGDAVRALPVARPRTPDESATAAVVRSEDVAYILFTSGTTGRPKGVPVTNGSMDHYLETMQRRYGFTSSDTFAQVVELSFDMAMFDLFAAWGCGGTVIAVRPQALADLPSFLTNHGVTVWFSAPSAISLVRRWNGLRPGSMPTLRWSLFAGEALHVDDARAWQEAASRATVDNHYGPTEVNVTCSVHRWDSDTSSARCVNGIVPIGELYEGLRHVLVDSEGRLTEGTGELCVSGPQTISGYLDPRDDEGRFFDHEGARWYRTGDIVRTQQDGQFAFLGRRDDQVQILGNRVQLSEIDHMLGKCRGVDKAVTIVVGERLVAFYTGRLRDQAGLREELAALLPQNLIPRMIRHVTEFRLTINGKVDRKHLGALARETNTAPAAASAFGTDH